MGIEENFEQGCPSSNHRKRLSPVEAAEQLSDTDFKEWYRKQIKDSRDQYWNDDCTCDRCGGEIPDVNSLRLMFGRRIHPTCFKLDYEDWLERGKEKGYIDPNAKLYFKRVLKVLGGF